MDRGIESDLEATPADPEDPAEDIMQTAGTIAHRGADRQDGGWGSGGPSSPRTGDYTPCCGLRCRWARRYLTWSRASTRWPTAASATTSAAASTATASIASGLSRTSRRCCTTRPDPRACLAGYQAIGSERYASVVRETFEFVQRELQHPDGGFVSRSMPRVRR